MRTSNNKHFTMLFELPVFTVRDSIMVKLKLLAPQIWSTSNRRPYKVDVSHDNGTHRRRQTPLAHNPWWRDLPDMEHTDFPPVQGLIPLVDTV